MYICNLTFLLLKSIDILSYLQVNVMKQKNCWQYSTHIVYLKIISEEEKCYIRCIPHNWIGIIIKLYCYVLLCLLVTFDLDYRLCTYLLTLENIVNFMYVKFPEAMLLRIKLYKSCNSFLKSSQLHNILTLCKYFQHFKVRICQDRYHNERLLRYGSLSAMVGILLYYDMVTQ